ncbi:DeoR family transcriptional regulator [Nonomuraea recticatena]|uniref:DeoR family transcriptional regulator n=1 Tax=Nonomuraea recticatena TaxID=46178 RepID=UPI0036236807
MSRYDRWNSILELLAQEGRLSVEDAAEALDVSTATIRRDFDQLAQQQMLMRTRGARSRRVSATTCRCATRRRGTPTRSTASPPRRPSWSLPAP